MVIDNAMNFILFLTRVGTLIVTAILSFNLLADWRSKYGQEHNGLLATRKAMTILVLAMLFENFQYGIGYIHAGFNTVIFNQFLTGAKPLLILARFGIFYGVLRLFLLFYHKKE